MSLRIRKVKVLPLVFLFFVASLLFVLPITLMGKGGVYSSTKHADPTTGVYRDTTIPRGECAQCHLSHDATSPNPFALFAPHTNSLCYTSGCHQTSGPNNIYQGPAIYDASSHATSTSMVWPGPDPSVDSSAPPAKPSGDWGQCINCHDPHGYNKDGTGLIPSLVFSREEKLCVVCHDGSPASKNVKAQFNKTYKHPTLTTSGKHSTTEDGASSAYGASPTNNRHAECADCHNLHYAKSGYLFPATSSYRIMGVSRIAVANGAAGMVPTYTYLPPSDTTTMPIAEYQLCFKCHSSWTTLPTGAKDKAVEFNTNNESFHPVEGPGTNMTTAMANSLAGGTGLPHLTTSDTIWCSDCHNSDDLPTTVTTLSNYSGFVPKGPHGSNVGFTDSNMSPKILRANYRVKLMPQSSSDNYNATNFTLCYICHKAAPFEDNSGNSRTDTNFRFHGFHLRKISNNPADGTAGDLETPGNGMAGQGNAICKECHYTIHSTKLTYYSTNRSNSRLVSFSPSISGPGGTGSPSWSQTGKSCSLKCHGKAHTPKTY